MKIAPYVYGFSIMGKMIEVKFVECDKNYYSGHSGYSCLVALYYLYVILHGNNDLMCMLKHHKRV